MCENKHLNTKRGFQSSYGTMACTCNELRISISESDELRNNYTGDKTCSDKLKKYAKRKLPILSWLPNYKLRYLLSDLIAGITVWLTAIPQSMGDAAIAGLSPEYGLYSHYVGPLVYVILGSCRQVTIGPTAVMSLLTYQTCGDENLECVILFGLYSGIVELALGLLELGVIISFISEPVTTGFTAGAAVTIASTQLKGLFGLAGGKGSKFIQAWKQVFEYGDTITLGDTVLGLTCLTALTVLWKVEHIKPPRWFGRPALWKKIMKTLTLTRNAVVMFLTCIIAYLWTDPPFALTGDVKGGFPDVGVPQLRLYDQNSNSNSTERMTFTETLEFVGVGPVMVALVAILQNVAISKAFGHGQSVDGTQEMISLGATNTIGGFLSCIPTTGSFTRSALNEASGVKSQLGGLFVGALMLLSLGVLTPTFQYVPKASLAAVVIAAMILMFMHAYPSISEIWRVSKIDFLCFLVTFFCSLGIGMEYGIVIGAGVNILIILLKSLRPRVSVQCVTHKGSKVKYVLLRPDQGLFFPGVDYIRDKVNKVSRMYPNYPVTVIECDKWTKVDYTSASCMATLAAKEAKMGRTLVMFKQPACWGEAFERLGGKVPVCCSNWNELNEVFQNVSNEIKVEKNGESNNNN